MCRVLLHICTCCIYKTHSMCCNYVSVCSILARDRKSVRRVRTTQSFWYDWLLVVVIGSFFSLHARLFFPYALFSVIFYAVYSRVFSTCRLEEFSPKFFPKCTEEKKGARESLRRIEIVTHHHRIVVHILCKKGGFWARGAHICCRIGTSPHPHNYKALSLHCYSFLDICLNHTYYKGQQIRLRFVGPFPEV